jgi:uncharacterized protein (DUF849 family)
MSPLLEAALNGARSRDEHPAIPRTPEELARASRAAVDAGADVLHVHAFDPDGAESLEGPVCAAVLKAVRWECPGIPISMTTSAAVEPDPTLRLYLVSEWTQLPDLVTANQGEEGIVDLCEQLMDRGVGIEAGLLSENDARAFVRSGIAERCARVLIEPLDQDVDDALAHAAAMESVLFSAGIYLEQVHHGEGVASWPVSVRALARGHGMRTGLEDMTVLPDGRPAEDNADLVRTAGAMLSTAKHSGAITSI